MDTLLKAGTHSVDGRGIPVTLTGHRELLQQAMIRMTIQKGRFALDTELGSELYKLAGCVQSVRDKVAAAYVQEALSPLRTVRVEDVTCRFNAPDVLMVMVTLAVDAVRYALEFRV